MANVMKPRLRLELTQDGPGPLTVEGPEMVGTLVVVFHYKGYKIAAAERGYRVLRATGEVLPIPALTVRAAYALIDHDARI